METRNRLLNQPGQIRRQVQISFEEKFSDGANESDVIFLFRKDGQKLSDAWLERIVEEMTQTLQFFLRRLEIFRFNFDQISDSFWHVWLIQVRFGRLQSELAKDSKAAGKFVRDVGEFGCKFSPHIFLVPQNGGGSFEEENDWRNVRDAIWRTVSKSQVSVSQHFLGQKLDFFSRLDLPKYFQRQRVVVIDD
jgi:hypothetical protein